MSELLACEPEAATVRSARLFVVDRLQQWGRDDLVDSAALLTSELVTNAVLHTAKPFTVRIAQRGAHVRVEVADSLHVLPSPPRGGTTGGALDLDHAFRGLTIVDSVASAWGSESIPGNGKIVWFELVGRRDHPGPRRHAASELSDLRDPGPRLATFDDGDAPVDASQHEARIEERLSELAEEGELVPSWTSVAVRWLLLLSALGAIVVIAVVALL